LPPRRSLLEKQIINGGRLYTGQRDFGIFNIALATFCDAGFLGGIGRNVRPGGPPASHSRRLVSPDQYILRKLESGCRRPRRQG
jgi:hypothetical protein